jgi:hypothetical protein
MGACRTDDARPIHRQPLLLRSTRGPCATRNTSPLLADVRGWLGTDEAWQIIDAAVVAGTDGSAGSADPGTWR